jgi:flagellin FlaB
MKAQFNRFMKDESGITALETAIILIAFVVVAAVFAFTVLSTGTFLTQKSQEAAYAGLQEVRGSMELKGSVVLESSGANIVFTLGTVAGGAPVDMTKVIVTYRDSATNAILAYTTGTTVAAGQWIATDTATTPAALTSLTAGNFAKITVKPTTGLIHDQTFSLEIKPPSGSTLLVERTTPGVIDTVTDLH